MAIWRVGGFQSTFPNLEKSTCTSYFLPLLRIDRSVFFPDILKLFRVPSERRDDLGLPSCATPSRNSFPAALFPRTKEQS
jgi:hypothetical protein